MTVSQEELSIAEDSEEDEEFTAYPDWQRQSLRDAMDIDVEWEKYEELPTKYEINEYRIMEEFCGSIENERISNALYESINGRGHFVDSKTQLGAIELKSSGMHFERMR